MERRADSRICRHRVLARLRQNPPRGERSHAFKPCGEKTMWTEASKRWKIPG